MGKQTPLYQQHVDQGGKIVDFGGWDMPLNYGSQIEEHHQVRNDAGMFDVSHMTVVDLKGDRVRDFLGHLLANDVARLKDAGKALYSCMLNEKGGVIDDLITYFMNDQWFRMVVNAATRDKDVPWIEKQAKAFDVTVEERPELAMVAVQGPNARAKALTLFSDALRESAGALKPFFAADDGDWFVGRTGYTGEDGFEVILPPEEAVAFWNDLAAAGVKPCGLGARDTLRLEAGMNLYGTDMDEDISPLQAALGWTIAWDPDDRDFIGRGPMAELKAKGGHTKLVGLLLGGRGMLRNHQTLYVGDKEVGEITSGGFSPTLNNAIAFARVDADVKDSCEVEVRGKRLSTRIVRPPFVRNGKSCID